MAGALRALHALGASVKDPVSCLSNWLAGWLAVPPVVVGGWWEECFKKCRYMGWQIGQDYVSGQGLDLRFCAAVMRCDTQVQKWPALLASVMEPVYKSASCLHIQAMLQCTS